MGILGEYLPNWLPQDPNQNAAARQGLLAAGAALLGGRGNLGGILAGGLMAGQQGYNGALEQQQQAGLAAAQQKRLDFENSQNEAGVARAARAQAVLQNGRQLPQLSGSSPLPLSTQPSTILARSQLPQLDTSSPGAGAPPQAPSIPRLPQIGQASSVSMTQQMIDQYMRDAAVLQDNQMFPEAQAQLEAADKLRKLLPEYDTTPLVGNNADGSAFTYVLSKNGEKKVLDGVLPREKMEILKLGGKDVAYNPFAVAPGQAFEHTVSPDTVYQGQVTMRGQDMADRRAAESNENSRGVIIQTDNGPMLANSRTGTTKPIVGPDGKPVTRTKSLTEFEGKSAAFGDRAMAADRTLRSLEGTYSPSRLGVKGSIEGLPLIGGGLGAAMNSFGMRKSDQLAEQAQRDFINATLRQESGAAIGASEFENARKQYFPQPGDSAEVRAQKAKNRQLVIEGFKRSAGSNAKFTNVDNGLPQGWTVEVH